MRTHTMAIPMAALMLVAAVSTPWAAQLHGTVQVGNIFVDEEGDRSAVQETFDVYEGFAVSRIQLHGALNPRSAFALELRDVNLDSRAGNLSYRLPGLFHLTAGYDQSRYVYDAGRGVTSERKDWKFGAQYTPLRSLVLSGDVARVDREGERLAYPLGTESVLGDRTNSAFVNARLAADWHRDRIGGGVSLQLSDYSDDVNDEGDRRGHVVAGRLYAPMPFWGKWNNLFRASYGTREHSAGDVEYEMSMFQYTAVVQPVEAWQLKYAFEASRVDDNALNLRTDRIQNDADLTWFHRFGRVNAGYGYETNDDDRTLTYYQSWHAGATLRPGRWLNARFDYAGRVKNDQEDLTLLKDVESSKIRGRLELKPFTWLSFGGDYAKRRRELPDIGVAVDGIVTGAFLRWDVRKWGAVSADYSHAIDTYDDRLAPFNTLSDIVTARAEVTRIKRLNLASGVTYLDIGRDLDIEKSIVFVEGGYQLAKRYHLNVKYNAYNYDDYVLLDRYYTANVVRVDLGYDL